MIIIIIIVLGNRQIGIGEALRVYLPVQAG